MTPAPAPAKPPLKVYPTPTWRHVPFILIGMPTLLRALQDATGLPRRKAFTAIREGHVTVDGATALDPSGEYERGELRIDGSTLVAAGPPAKVYLLLNKPPGVVTTASDELGRRGVLELVPASLRAPGLHAVGRLDRDTSGLLLLTNDGDLTYRLTHPRHEIEKEYWIALWREADDVALHKLRSGVELDGARRHPVRLERIDVPPFELSMTISEGRKRQVRRMVEAVGSAVTSLRRVREGTLTLGTMPEGAVRPLTPSEVEGLLA
jgi:23S rRNA pseudouridine2605 synthase